MFNICLLAGSNQDSLPGDQQPNVVNCASCQQLVLEGNALHELPALNKYGWFCDKCQQQATLRGAILLVRDASNASALAISMFLMIQPGHTTNSLPSSSQTNPMPLQDSSTAAVVAKFIWPLPNLSCCKSPA